MKVFLSIFLITALVALTYSHPHAYPTCPPIYDPFCGAPVASGEGPLKRFQSNCELNQFNDNPENVFEYTRTDLPICLCPASWEPPEPCEID